MQRMGRPCVCPKKRREQPPRCSEKFIKRKEGKQMKHNQKGITLIALIITIIVMLILVSVSITIAVNNGLFKAAQSAAQNTTGARDNELVLANAQVNIVGEAGAQSIDAYVQGLTGQGGTAATYTAYSVGEEVTLGTGANAETFYVIKDSDETESTVLLLTAKNVETTNFTQSASANNVEFDVGEWDSNSKNWYKPGTETPVTNVYANASISGLVASYKTALKTRTGITVESARLMLKDEATSLQSGHTDILYATNYWLGSPSENFAYGAWDVDGEDEHLSGSHVYGGFYGLRPVIEVSKSNI